MEIVMMGDPNSGRTSILKIIFQKMMPSRAMMLAETKKMESYEFKIEKLDFRVYDFPCSYDTHEGSPNEQMILKNAVALIYVLDPTRDIEKSIPHFLQLYDYIK
jgi:Fe2+ transport system protein B